jgi:hypothetical protein
MTTPSTSPSNPPPPQQDEVETYAGEESTQEPTSGDFAVSVSVPEVIEIRMVDASTLSDYEIWFFASGGFLTFAVAFLVAYIQEMDPKVATVLLIVAVLFGVVFALFLIMTLVKRHALRKKGRTIQLRTSRVGTEKH